MPLDRLAPLADAVNLAVAQQRLAIDAADYRQEELVLPWHLKWVPPILELLPLGLRDALLDVAGAASAMGGFRGRGAAQWEQMSGSVG